MSDYTKSCLGEKKTKNYKTQKLTATFEDRINYVTHYNNLRFYLNNGMKLLRVRRVMSFTQRPILKDYIEHCTEMRRKSTSENRKALFKLQVNSVFGKTIENKRKYTTCNVHRSEASFTRSMNSMLLDHFKIINKDLVLSFSKSRQVTLDKSIQIGFSTLEASKLQMFYSYYKEILPKLGSNTRLLLSDTDSFILRISPAPNHSHCLKQLSDILDFSNYPQNHSLYEGSRKNALGYFKDETRGERIREYIGIRSKVYTFRTKKSQKNTVKGIVKKVKQKIPFETFKKCIMESAEIKVDQYLLRSKRHEITLGKQRKLAFTASDDKRYQICPFHTLGYKSKYTKRESKKCSLCCQF